jgi:ComF family protein
MMPRLRLIGSTIVETLYPKVCPGCGLRGTWLCGDCEETLPRLDTRICDRCGSPSQAHCTSCKELDPLIRRARSAYPYTGWIAEAIRRFKYDEEYSRSEDLGARLALTLRQFDKIDALVPVPLHRSKFHSRGYNQSQLLAERASEILDIPVQPILRRHRATAPQVSLQGSDRRLNVVDAFEVDPAWVVSQHRSYALIDDVRTTGATLGACARALSLKTDPTIFAVTLALDVRKAELDAWLLSVRDDQPLC